jgi:nitrite reductase/ring-hydroxylating ferredoxin subunit
LSSDWVDVGPVDSLEDSKSLTADIDGEPLDGAEVEACQIICPRHGAHFCARTGEALTPPAYEPLRTFKVRVDNGRILVENPV